MKKTSYKIFTRTTGIYSITCKTTNRRYVGQSKDIASRWKQHLYQLQRGTHHCKSLQDAFSSSSVENFDFTVLLICKKKTLTENEIKIWDTFSNNYNGRPTGQVYPEATAETRRKISESAKGNTNSKGYKHSTETKKLMSKVKKGNTIREGTKHSAETKLKMSQAHKGVKHSPERIRKTAEAKKKPILQYSLEFGFIVEWASATDAGKATGINKGSIGKCCNGKLKTAGGYLWKFKEKK